MGAEFDLSQPGRSVHVVGVGGAGMSAIASVLASMGHRVTGSDLKPSTGLERLRAQGIEVHVPHAAEHVGDVEAVAVSTAIPATNPEVQEAVRRGIPVLRRADILAAISATRRTVAVAGTHGKTTTSSMLAVVLRAGGLDPSFIIGGELNEIGTGAVWDRGDWFVVEADESDGTFLELGAEAVVITNVEPDHLYYWGTFGALAEAFERFASAAPGPRVLCADDAGSARLAHQVGGVTYGTSVDADYRIVDVEEGRSGVVATIEHGGEALGLLQVAQPGLHTIRNATAALVCGLELGVTFEAAAGALARFAGVARRFQHRGRAAGVTFVDDYAHLPTEVAAALEAAGTGGWRRVVAVFQPHRYTRTAETWREFGDAFAGADLLVVTDIYAAGERPLPGISGKLVADSVLAAHPWQRVAWLPHRDDVVAFLRSELRDGDLCLTLGAGDLTTLPDELLALLGDG